MAIRTENTKIVVVLLISIIFVSLLPFGTVGREGSNSQNLVHPTTSNGEQSRGMETIWYDDFEGGSFIKWDSIPSSSEISILQSGSNNFGGQSTQASNTGSQKFVEGWDNNNQLNFLEKTFVNLDEYAKIKLKFYWAEQDIELDETCDIKIYDKINGYQTLKTIGSNNGNEDGIVLSDWNIEQYDLYNLGAMGLNEITDWSEVRFRFEWVAALDNSGEVAADQWFLDDVELLGDHRPQLLNGKVWPQEGTILNTYEFSVSYYDSGNDAPFFVKLNLNEENLSMVEFDEDDLNYIDGKLFIYSTELVWGLNYSYNFWSSDGLQIISTPFFNGPVVNKGPPHKIIVTAPSSDITSDESLQFYTTAFDKHNNPVDFTPEWSVNGGGYINDAGKFTATEIGYWTAYANYTDGSYHASGHLNFTVTPGKLKDLVIKSSILSIPPVVSADDIVFFHVAGVDADFNPVPLDDYTITMTVTGGGILHPNGTFEPEIEGFYKIFANTTVDSIQISDYYEFQIIQGIGVTLKIFASELQIKAGNDILFTVKVYDSDSNSFTPSSVLWSVSGGGTISELGIFKAEKMGNFNVSAIYVNARNESITASLDFGVKIGKLKGINIIHEKNIIFINESMDMFAEGYDVFGNKEIIKPDWASSGGYYDNISKQFTANKAGKWIIYANISDVSGSITLYVNAEPLSYITIEPDSPVIMINEELQLLAKGYDKNDKELFIEPVWNHSGAGSIDRNGKFSSDLQGIYFVYANFSGISAGVEIIVNQYNLNRIEITPSAITLKVNEAYRFNATGFAVNGIEVFIKPKWSITGTKMRSANITNDGKFVATEIGTWRIYASQSDFTGTAEIIVIEDETPGTKDNGKEEKGVFDESLLLPLILIIIVAIIIIALYLTVFRIRNKLEKDRKDAEAEGRAMEEEYARVYGDLMPGSKIPGLDDKFGQPMYPEHDINKRSPAKVPKPRTKVKEVKVIRHKKKRRWEPSPEHLKGGGSLTSAQVGPMRYGYKTKKIESDIPMKAPLKANRLKEKKAKASTKTKKDEPEIEWE